ncbi:MULTISPECIES: nuclear transport factor 2 family protein [Bradyrhizobium]|uniref:nuclear transport factor 2 family protein n=1 Tax=Bradyrhizobium elkanii TaxID=29448 RepID=UPI0004033AE7|nr:nuclear transport factor 2 family protein [Bradyrhizobium elkanii]
MKNALELLQSYLDNIRNPAAAAALYAEDGILELPWVKAHAQGPEAIERLIAGVLAKIPDFGFGTLEIWIDTPDKVFAETRWKRS